MHLPLHIDNYNVTHHAEGYTYTNSNTKKLEEKRKRTIFMWRCVAIFSATGVLFLGSISSYIEHHHYIIKGVKKNMAHILSQRAYHAALCYMLLFALCVLVYCWERFRSWRSVWRWKNEYLANMHLFRGRNHHYAGYGSFGSRNGGATRFRKKRQ
mmetsp:Transcript_6351/g.9263  ORF Transcript_6351/g.9263 Transcript_6351/m.9263 type:complete len:155 (+) Transcript_6351:185-649(+)